jgi:hypothetical protein
MIKSRKIRWAGHVASTGEMRTACIVLVGKPEWKRQLGRSKPRWEYNIRVDFRERGWDVVDWILLAHNRDQF